MGSLLETALRVTGCTSTMAIASAKTASAVLWASSNAWAERRGGRDCGRRKLWAPPDRKFALPPPKTASQLVEGKLFQPLSSLRAKETSVMCHKTIISIFPLRIGYWHLFLQHNSTQTDVTYLVSAFAYNKGSFILPK